MAINDLITNNECWRDIPGYEGLYEVSNFGNVLSHWKKIPRLLKPFNHASNYRNVYLRNRQRVIRYWGVHQLVLLAFIGKPPPRNVTNHINGIKSDNRLVNLEYCTQRENLHHAKTVLGKQWGGFKHRFHGQEHPSAKLNDESVAQIKQRLRQGDFQRVIAFDFGVSQATVSLIALGKSWHHVN